ncbi:5529_t:CDS:1, partial [Dentiscutata heterogama]
PQNLSTTKWQILRGSTWFLHGTRAVVTGLPIMCFLYNEDILAITVTVTS